MSQAGSKKMVGVSPTLKSTLSEAEALEKLSWRNWTAMVAVILLTTIGLYTGVFPEIRDRVGTFWPWAGTDEALTGGLTLIMLLFTAYLTQQQRQVMALRKRLKKSYLEANEGMQMHCERLFALLNVTRTLATETDPEAIFECITTACRETFEAQRVSLMLLDRETEELAVRAATGHRKLEEVRQHRMKMGEGIAGWVAQHRQPLILGKSIDVTRYPGFKPSGDIHAAMVVPILVRDELVGVLNVGGRKGEREYEEGDLQALMVFAENAGITCRHAEQTNWMRATIQRLDAELRQKEAKQNPRAA